MPPVPPICQTEKPRVSWLFILEYRMKINQKPNRLTNHEGVTVTQLAPVQQLRRTVLACMLWENGFYESGQTIAERIKMLVPQCGPDDVAEVAIHAREVQRLRHVPLLLVRELARLPQRAAPGLISQTLARVVQRADELAEFLALYWEQGKAPLSKQVKTGLASAFGKFDEYQLAKYNRENAIKLRDVLFMVHAKPKDDAQAALWKRLADDQLATPDTWEVALSGGADKKAAFERLLAEGKLGYMALLRNLRNMQRAIHAVHRLGVGVERRERQDEAEAKLEKKIARVHVFCR
jgi:60 kDa SS-A/Ro ribonucleoprotein